MRRGYLIQAGVKPTGIGLLNYYLVHDTRRMRQGCLPVRSTQTGRIYFGIELLYYLGAKKKGNDLETWFESVEKERLSIDDEWFLHVDSGGQVNCNTLFGTA